MTAPTATAGPRPIRSRAWLGRALVAVLAAAALLLGSAAPAAAGEADDIHSGLNQARAESGLGALNRNASLDAAALGWANQMAANGAISHNPGVSGQIPAGWSAVGENVAQGQPTGSAMNSAWSDSPGHRANMLGGYSDVGIAFVSAGGTTWGVEVFALYGQVPAPVAAPRAGNPAAPAAPGAAAQQQAAAQQAAEQAAAEQAAEQAAAEQAAADAAAAQLAADAAAAEQAAVLAAQTALSTTRSALDGVAASAAALAGRDGAVDRDGAAGSSENGTSAHGTGTPDPTAPVTQRSVALSAAILAIAALALLWGRRARHRAAQPV